jgi:hypothetical protein
MKQAEVLNAMAHVNYQVRQAYKLLVWRYWGLASFGNNPEFNFQGTSKQWLQLAGPAVCVTHPMWLETVQKSKTPTPENLCARPYTPKLTPVTLTPIQSLGIYSFMQIFAAQSAQNAAVFNQDFNNTGIENYEFALKLIAQYKLALAQRRRVMQALEKILVDPSSGAAPDNFLDLQGHPVKDTVLKVFANNLTLANKGAQIAFINGVFQRPFIVPREARVMLRYVDFIGAGNGIQAEAKDLRQLPSQLSPTDPNFAAYQAASDIFAGTDYISGLTPASAQNFLNEDEGDPRALFRSVMTFEKNPWVMAYVGVHVTSHPTMLFSPMAPGSNVELVADAYAMPFGGHIGPWISSTWQPGTDFSSGGSRIDGLLPPLFEDAFSGRPDDPKVWPNYSKYPGDQEGMNDRGARDMGMDVFHSLESGRNQVSWKGDYSFPESLAIPYEDFLPKRPGIRAVELLALSPDLFDAAYYSIDPFFTQEPQAHQGHRAAERAFVANLCNQGCYDFGSVATQTGLLQAMNVASVGPGGTGGEGQMSVVHSLGNGLAWKLDSPNYLYTSWTQESSTNFGGPAQSIGVAPQNGGRSGYSVKIVSHDYFYRPLPLGGQGVSGRIINPP